MVFSTTHAEIGQTIDQWLEVNPSSIHARTAKGWQQYHLSWISRGERTIRETHPAAFEDMRMHLAEFRKLMWSVYRDEPSFVPGSDGVLRSYLNGGNPTPIMDVISEIMALTPNYGSMSRALHSVSPRWGGSVREMNEICDRFAHLVEDRVSYDAKRCNVLSAIFEKLRGRPMAWAVSELSNIPPDQEIYAHLYAATILEPDEKPSSEHVVAWYQEWGGFNRRIAESIEFDYGVEGFLFDEDTRHAPKADAALENDPLNPKLLLSVAKRRHSYKLPDAEKAEIYQLVQRAAVLGFRQPQVWLAQARFYEPQFKVESYPVTRELYEKAVVYSNYHPYYLEENFLDTRVWSWALTEALQQVSEGGDLTAVQQGYVADDPQKQLADINCEYVRAARLLDAVCQSQDGTCSKNQVNRLAEKTANTVGEDRMCPANYDVGLQDLLYPEQP